MIRHHFVSKNLYLRTQFQQPPLLIDECPSNRCLFYDSLRTIMRERAKQRLPGVGHYRHMYDAWFSPCSRLQPRMCLVPRYIYVLVCHLQIQFAVKRRDIKTLPPCYNCRKGNHYFTNLCQNCKLLLTSRSFPSSPRSPPPFVPFFSCGLHPHLMLFQASILLHSIALPTPIRSAFSFPTAFFFAFSFARIGLITTFAATSMVHNGLEDQILLEKGRLRTLSSAVESRKFRSQKKTQP